MKMKNKEVLSGLKWFFSFKSVLMLWFPFLLLNMMFYSTKAGEKVLEQGDKVVSDEVFPFIFILFMFLYVIMFLFSRSQERYYQDIALRRMNEDEE